MDDFELVSAYLGAMRDRNSFWTWDFFFDYEAIHLLALVLAVLVMGSLLLVIMNSFMQRSDVPVPRRWWLLPAVMAVVAFAVGLGADWLDVCMTFSDYESQMLERGLI